VFSEVIPHTASVEEIRAREPLAVVLSRPGSVYTEGAPQLDPALFDLGVRFRHLLRIQAMAQALGGTVAHNRHQRSTAVLS